MASNAYDLNYGDIGVFIDGTYRDENAVVQDVSSATAQVYEVRKPDGSEVTWITVFKVDGVDGVVTYETVSGDINHAGSWVLRGKITLISGAVLHSDPIVLRVGPPVFASP